MRLLVLFCLLARLTLSDVSISLPLPGQSYKASGGSISIPLTWIESNTDPLLPKITSYTFTLCAGPSSAIHAFNKGTKVAASQLDGYSYDYSVDSSEGADGNYYVQIYAVSDKGITIHYSNIFALSGMSGAADPSLGKFTEAPSAQTSTFDGTNTGIISIDSHSFTVAYSLQTGKTRYAPMQTQPGSKVTRAASDWSRRYPTSAVTYYSALLPSLAQLSTLTPGWDYTLSSAINWASPAPRPTDNGGWYAASDRLTRKASVKFPSVLATATT